MILEFYGLPGSGKTTDAKKIAEEYNFEIIKIDNKKELFYYNFLFFLKNPIKFFLTFLILIKESGKGLFYYKFMNTFLHHNAKYEKARKIKRAIIDQGHWQNIISVFEKEMRLKCLRRYAKFLPKPDKLIVYNIDGSLRKERIKERGYGARESLDKRRKEKWEEVIEYNNKNFLENIDKFSPNYLIVKSSEDIKSWLKNKM